jgi:hypothetical protein
VPVLVHVKGAFGLIAQAKNQDPHVGELDQNAYTCWQVREVVLPSEIVVRNLSLIAK